MYDELFGDTSLELGKTLSKTERDSKQLTEEKVGRWVVGRVVFNKVAKWSPIIVGVSVC